MSEGFLYQPFGESESGSPFPPPFPEEPRPREKTFPSGSGQAAPEPVSEPSFQQFPAPIAEFSPPDYCGGQAAPAPEGYGGQAAPAPEGYGGQAAPAQPQIDAAQSQVTQWPENIEAHEAVDVDDQEFEEQFSADLKKILKKVFIGVVVIGILTVAVFFSLKFFNKSTAVLVEAKTGAKITTNFGVEIEVPPYALRNDAEITVEKVENGKLTDLYKFGPEGTKFTRAVTVKIPYDEKVLAGLQDPSIITLEYWKDSAVFKKRLKFTVDKTNKKLVTQVWEF